MYNVMKRYTVSRAREKLADVLNEVDRTGGVLIERGNVQYEIRARRAARPRKAQPSVIETVDEGVANGQWSWQLTASGLRFRPRS
jgi:hypothetical protein